jgi:propanediol utilization protein
MDQGITVTILAIEDVRRVGTVVHVRVDKIPWQRCGDVQLTRAIEHLAVTKDMMLKSGLVLSRDNVDLPESSIEAYRKWEGQKKHAVAKVPLKKAIFDEGAISGPMICNFVPSQT